MPAFPTFDTIARKPSYQDVLEALRDGRWRRHPFGPGLILHMPFVSGGGIPIDIVRNPISVVGATWQNTGRMSPGMAFSGAGSQDINAGTAANSATGALTVELWLTANASTNYPEMFCRHNSSTADWRMNIFSNSGLPAAGLFQVSTNGTEGTFVGSNTPTNIVAGQLCHFVGTASVATGIIAYLNGKGSTATALSTGVSNTGTISTYLGMRQDGTQPFDGAIYLASIWNRVLSASDVAERYADPFALLRAPKPYWLGYAASGGTVHPETLAVTETPVVGLRRVVQLARSIAQTPVVAIQKQVGLARTVAESAVASVARQVNLTRAIVATEAVLLSTNLVHAVSFAVTEGPAIGWQKMVRLVRGTTETPAVSVTAEPEIVAPVVETPAIDVQRIIEKEFAVTESPAINLAAQGHLAVQEAEAIIFAYQIERKQSASLLVPCILAPTVELSAQVVVCSLVARP